MKRIIDYYNLENLLVKYQETHEDKLTRNEVKLIDSVLFEISTPTKETSSPIEEILFELDVFRKNGMIDYSAYSSLHDLISKLDVQEWTSVKDGLPEERHNPVTDNFEEVICFVDFGGQPKRTDVRAYPYGTSIGEKEAHFWHGLQIMDSVVTHWMYKPKPPKEDEE